ncbi:E3 SUMO-protein ligase ZBED1-like [Panonychus citri]|uniref:E3 SUMO-protein ligase ZBED1-like n=1 Tax=Panonychus citri TaxID=50023 RepID=UPI00230706B8|nr:E3 SUMO-protein ligase ZBED1-like [Panonychus citri]
MPKPKSSKIWKYFSVNGESDPKCVICGKSIKSTGNTTNLMKHLKANHFSVFNDYSQTNQDDTAKIDTFISDINSIKGGDMNKNINSKLLWWIIKNAHPYRVCEQKGFKEFITSLNKHYSPPLKDKVNRLIRELYDTKKSQVTMFLNNVKGLSLTSDGWKDVSNQISYIGLTAHFIDEYKLHSVCLKANQIQESTSDNISSIFDQTIEDWGILKENIMCITTDGAANYSRAAKSVSNHIHCIAHQLNLIVEDGLENSITLSQLICRTREIVTAFKRSSVLMSSLTSLQEERNESSLKLIQDVPTRWNSTYHMIERYLVLHKEISCALIEHDKRDIDLSSEDVELLKEVSKVLQPFDEITKDISGEKYITISRIIPVINILKSLLTKLVLWERSTKALVVTFLTSIERRFGGLERNKLFAFSTLLDPRFKKIDFNSTSDCSDAVVELNKLLTQVELSQNLPEPEEDIGIWSVHNKRAKALTATKTALDSGLKHYQDSDVLPLTDDPLSFWRNNKLNWPQLHNLALKYLCIQPTSVPCERLFSKTGSIITEKRNRLKPKNVDMLCFLESLPQEFI